MLILPIKMQSSFSSKQPSPCQIEVNKMNHQIQQAHIAERMEEQQSTFYQEYCALVESELANIRGNQHRLAFITNLQTLIHAGTLLPVFNCYRGIDSSSGLMRMSHSTCKNLLDSTMGNDYYKWTMAPVFVQIAQRHGPQKVKFLVDFRSTRVSDMIRRSPELQQKIRNALSSLASRSHDSAATLSSIPNQRVSEFFKHHHYLPDTLADPLIRDSTVNLMELSPDSKPVIAFYLGPDCFGNIGPIIEICGRHEHASWLETSVLQVLYEIIRREDNQARNISEVKALFESLYRTHLSMVAIDSTSKSLITAILMVGRRTQSPLFLLLANLYLDHFSEKFKGTSSVWAWNVLNNVLGITLKFNLMGTHAHELSMLLGGMGFGKYGQIVGHYLYWLTHIYGTTLQFLALPDTFGTVCFLEVAKRIFVKLPDDEIVPFLSLIKGFRQDSGSISKFVELVRRVIPNTCVLASEIGCCMDLYEADRAGCYALGTGGFCGDSEKAFPETIPNGGSESSIELACKIGQVEKNCLLAKYGDDVGKCKGNPFDCTELEYHERIMGAVNPSHTTVDSRGQRLNDARCYLLTIGHNGAVFTPYSPPS